jgi:hypothetical protein
MLLFYVLKTQVFKIVIIMKVNNGYLRINYTYLNFRIWKVPFNNKSPSE